MNLIWQGTDITKDVDIVSAVHRDTANGRNDCLELMLEHANTWFQWNPQTDDTIEMRIGGYSTGTLFLDTIIPDGERFRVLATGVNGKARAKGWKSFEKKTLSQIVGACAGEIGMGQKLYGVSGGLYYPYILRKNESPSVFLKRLLRMEGAVLKAYNGKFTGIGVLAAQNLSPVSTLEISTRQKGVFYEKRENTKIRSLTVVLPEGSVTASDSAAGKGYNCVVSLPTTDMGTAQRWARGLVLMNNRDAETLEINIEMDYLYTAMSRIDITSDMGATGKWVIDEVEHDFVLGASRMTMKRLIESVG